MTTIGIREVPVHPKLAAVKWRFLTLPGYVANLQKAKRRLAARADVTLAAHQLRKTFASCLYDAGAPDEVVGDLLGTRHP